MVLIETQNILEVTLNGEIMKKNNQIIIFSLEEIETRYTGQWKKHLPSVLEKYSKENNILIEIFDIQGEKIESSTTEGAFLNFSLTNIYKNSQMNEFFKLVNQGVIKEGAKVLFPDAWHTGIIQCRYLSDLLNLNFEIHSIWHAGSYDPNDFLGRKVKDKKWSYSFENSLFHASDYNYYATKYHFDLFKDELKVFNDRENPKGLITGLPFEFLFEELEKYSNLEKENIILFPHRISVEKQPEIFKDLSNYFPNYQFVFCQDKKLSKHEYHTLLGKSKFMFSANLQETLGIGAIESIICNTVPILPNRLSYSEMYDNYFKYDSKYTTNYSSYEKNKDKLLKTINNFINDYENNLFNVKEKLNLQKEKLYKSFCSPNKMYELICKEV